MKNIYSFYFYDPLMTQLGHVDRNFMKFYAILCNFTTKKALLQAYITNGADDGISMYPYVKLFKTHYNCIKANIIIQDFIRN